MIRELTQLLREEIKDLPTKNLKNPSMVTPKPSSAPTKEYSVAPKIPIKPKIDTQEFLNEPQNVEPEPEFLDNASKLASRANTQRKYFPDTNTMNAFKDSARKQMDPNLFAQKFKSNVDLLTPTPIKKEEPSPQRSKLQALGILPKR